MKPLYVLVLILLYTTIVRSQIQDVIGNTGESFTQNDIVLEFTLGEPIIQTFANNSLVLTQGFHQPDIKRSTTTIDFEGRSFDLNVYPNPFKDRFSISIETSDHPINRIDIVDINGRLLETLDMRHKGQSITIDGSQYGDGIYFLRYKSDSGQIIFADKVLKIQ